MDDPHGRSLDDDPRFLASVDDLDRGLSSDEEAESEFRPQLAAPSQPALAAPFPPKADPPPPRPVSLGDELTYETFYGSTEKPFSLSTDPKFLYHSAAHDHAAQNLLTAIGRRDGVVVVTGPLGAGKTTFCRVITEQLDRRTVTSLLVDPLVSVEDFLQKVLIDFGVMSRDDRAGGAEATPEALSATLQSFLVSLASLEASAVVLVDEAQHLPVTVLDAIRIVTDVGGDKTHRLQVVLVGQPTLTALLRRPELRQLDQRVTTRCELGPLAPDEIAGYVMHRLAVAGNSPRVDFDAAAITRIYDLSGGLPRTVNVLCDRALSRGFQASASVIDATTIDGAAEDLDVTAPVAETPGAPSRVVAGLLFVLLVLAGAAGATWVFRQDVARAIEQWRHVWGG